MPRIHPGIWFLLLAFPPLALPAEKATAAWSPPVPAVDKFDWIQLKSGEWLKGEIKGMENDKVMFDSEELDLHTFDMDDVIFIRSPRIFDLLRSDRSVVTGPIEISATAASVGGYSFPREEMTAFSAGGKGELQHWTGKLSAGLIIRAGNTKSSDLTYSVGVTRRTAATRLQLDFDQNNSQLDGEDTADNQRGSITFDKFTSGRAFVRIPSVEYLQDQFQNIAYRVTVGASYGYDFYKKKNFKLDATLGPAWQFSEFNSVQPGEELKHDAGALVLTSHLQWDLTDRIEYTLDYRGQFTSKETGETAHHVESVLSVDLTKRLELDLSTTWDRIAQPKADDAGVVPEPDDLRLSVMLSIKL